MIFSAVVLAISLISVDGYGEGKSVHEDEMLRSLGEALAFQKACPTVALDRDHVARSLAKAGIRLAPHMARIEGERPYHDLAIANLDVFSICRLARQYYGETGIRAAGFLSDR